jgi:hypothetical protein
MINLYIFMTVLIGFLILLTIQFKIYNPSKKSMSNPTFNNNNSNILDYYGKYGSLGNYSNYNDFKSKCEK